MNSHLIALHLRDLFEATCYELFAQLNGEIRPVQNVEFDGSEAPFARIDAGCDDFDVEISLSLPFSALAMTYPVQCDIAHIDEAELEDWLSELSNRLMGKLKRNLLMYSVDLKIGLPDFSFGYTGGSHLNKRGFNFTFHFEFDHEIFEANLFIEIFNGHFTFDMKAAEQNAVADGDVEFF